MRVILITSENSVTIAMLVLILKWLPQSLWNALYTEFKTGYTPFWSLLDTQILNAVRVKHLFKHYVLVVIESLARFWSTRSN